MCVCFVPEEKTLQNFTLPWSVTLNQHNVPRRIKDHFSISILAEILFCFTKNFLLNIRTEANYSKNLNPIDTSKKDLRRLRFSANHTVNRVLNKYIYIATFQFCL